MPRLDLKSREYKVMLLPERFGGEDERVRRAAGEFWADVNEVLNQLDVPIPTQGAFDRVKAHRRIKFFDTAEHGFNARKYVFRERVDVESGQREVTLKFRHADRYLASDREMDAKTDGRVETKFEEDVKPPFVSVFSYSTSVELASDIEMASVRQVVDLFPGLAHAVRDLDGASELSVVRTFCARELVLVGASLLLGKQDIEAECALVVWHDDDDLATPPVCVEFSFKYGDDDEDYRGTVTSDAHDVLQTLNEQLQRWVHPEPRTKTAFVYG
jgi:hypothetical protein